MTRFKLTTRPDKGLDKETTSLRVLAINDCDGSLLPNPNPKEFHFMVPRIFILNKERIPDPVVSCLLLLYFIRDFILTPTYLVSIRSPQKQDMSQVDKL